LFLLFSFPIIWMSFSFVLLYVYVTFVHKNRIFFPLPANTANSFHNHHGHTPFSFVFTFFFILREIYIYIQFYPKRVVHNHIVWLIYIHICPCCMNLTSGFHFPIDFRSQSCFKILNLLLGLGYNFSCSVGT